MSGHLKPGFTPLKELKELMEIGRADGDVGQNKADAMLANPGLQSALATVEEKAAAVAAVETELRPAPKSEAQVATVIEPAATQAGQRAVAPAKPAAGMPVDPAAEPVAPRPEPRSVVLTPPPRLGIDEPTDVVRDEVRAIGTHAVRRERDGEAPPPPPEKPILGYALAGLAGLLFGSMGTLAFTGSAAPPAVASASALAAPVCPPAPAPKACEPCAACPAVEPAPPCPTASPGGPSVQPPKPPRSTGSGSPLPDILP